jgi:D-glycero-D-manno-heptose 1,7-bisphosphate phosphatase
VGIGSTKITVSKPAVFLDRDGTLNVQVIRDGKPYAPRELKDFRLFPDIIESCAALKKAGYLLIVATNQPDVGRGDMPQATVEAMHAELLRLIPSLDLIEVSYESGKEPSARRKPEPGMLLDAAKSLNIDLSRSWMVGDRWRDIDCGKRAGVKTIFIDYTYDEVLQAKPDYIVSNFKEAAKIILNSNHT